jgi:hypothetical protein
MSIPVADGIASGVLEIGSTFFEFIPEQEIDAIDLDPDAETLPSGLTVLRAEELELGQRYYIVLITCSGLYRYHIGDLIQVTGWMGTAPTIEFLSRGAHTSNLTGEKLTEYQVVSAVNAALKDAGLALEASVMVPIWADPPYYRLIIEGQHRISADHLRMLGSLADQNLAGANCEYASKRRSRRLGHVQVVCSQDGRLAQADREAIISMGGRSDEFKHRFLLNRALKD